MLIFKLNKESSILLLVYYLFYLCRCGVRVRVLVHRSQRLMLPSSSLYFICLRQGLSLNLESVNLIRLAGQKFLGVFLAVSHTTPVLSWWVLKETNSSSHGCIIGAFWLDHLPSLFVFSVNQTMRSHALTFFTSCFIATPSRECLKCKAIPISPSTEVLPFWRTHLSVTIIFSSSGHWPSSIWSSQMKGLAHKVTSIIYLDLNFTVGLHWTCAIFLHLTVVPHWPAPDETG